jgi:hypothetical protein
MSASERPTIPISLFYSYSHKDEALRKKLETHLSPLQAEGVISGWHDRRIAAGTEWSGAIREQLDDAGVVLLLVSPDFIASRYCWDVEIKRAMERHESGEARVIPVILRPVDWHFAPFGKLQALPRDGRAVTEWPNRDQAFRDVARGIRETVLGPTSATPNPPTLAQPTSVGASSAARPQASDRATLIITISGLSPSDMAILVSLVEGAASRITHHATVPQQAAQLVRWAESSLGPGLTAIREALACIRY